MTDQEETFQEIVDRMIPDRRQLASFWSETFDIPSSAGPDIPCEVSISPDYGIYVRTVIGDKIVDVQLMMPYSEEGPGVAFTEPNWRLGVVVDENDTVIYHDDLKTVVDNGRDVG